MHPASILVYYQADNWNSVIEYYSTASLDNNTSVFYAYWFTFITTQLVEDLIDNEFKVK